MSSNSPPKYRKKLDHKRERKPPHPARAQRDDEPEGTQADTLPASETGSFIEPVTKDDPTASRRPSVQEQPPRLRGP